ncbi:MAG TPA: hypothetical protein GX742_03330 [Acholeplasmataceae bacterium]|nr:hypothetical protein [Acholeplasmataceae bacterium]
MEQILNKDSKYLLIYNQLTDILSRYERNLEEINDKFNKSNNQMLLANRDVLEHYSAELDKLNRGRTISINKNQQEIKKFRDDAEEKIRHLKIEVITSKKVYLESIELAKAKYLRETNDALKTHDEEIEAIDKELKQLRDEYRVIIQKVEADKEHRLRDINNTFNTKKSEIESKISVLRKDADQEINLIKNDTEEHRINTDESYLTIKKSHTQTSIKLNDFINKRKKEKLSIVELLKTKYEDSLKPFETEKSSLATSYQQELDSIQAKYAARVQTLNIQFDLQKNDYNTETGNIIKANSLAKTKINSDFSALTRSIEDSKQLETTKRNKELLRKDITDIEKAKVNKEYKKAITILNKKLSDAIKTNQKNVNRLKVQLQQNLYNHDLNHIEQINNWRYNKNVYQYENNQSILKTKNQYDLQLLKISLKENLLKLNLNNDILIEENKLKKDLLPIESQLSISSLIQEREINLLNTEDETYQNIFTLKQAIITNKFFLDKVELRYELDLISEQKRLNEAIINVETQLELEQLKLKRNHGIYTLKLNKELQSSLLQQKNNIETIKKDKVTYEANLNINNLEARSLFETKNHRKNALIELEKRQTIIHQVKIKTQRQELQNKIERTIELAKNEANLHEEVNHNFFNEAYTLYQIGEQITKLVDDLFKLPSHPETFRQFLKQINLIFIYLKDEFNFLIKEYTTIDNKLFNNRIASMTEHKYRIKHEEIINIFSNNINQIEAKRNELLKQYEDIQSQIVLIQKKKALNHSIVDNYLKINKNEKSRNKKALIKYNNVQIKVLKDEIKLLNKNQNESNKEIIRLSNKVIPLDKQIKRLEKRQKDAEERLNNQRHREEFKYLKLQKKHINSYLDFSNNLEKRIDIIINTFQSLIDKAYLSNNYFTNQETKISKNILGFINFLVLKQQELLNNWLELFNITKDDQDRMYANFVKTTNYALDRIEKNHKKFLDTEEKEKVNYSKTYLNETERNNDLILKAKNSMEQSIKNDRTSYRETYRNTEIAISNNSDLTNKQILLISENLRGVKDDFQKEHLVRLAKIEKNKKKNELEFKDNINIKTKELNVVDKKNNIKTKVIFDRYKKDKERNLKAMQLKSDKYSDLIKNINSNKRNDELKLKTELRLEEKSNDQNNRNIDIKINTYYSTTKKEQAKIIKKEQKTLLNSYKFKIKELK